MNKSKIQVVIFQKELQKKKTKYWRKRWERLDVEQISMNEFYAFKKDLYRKLEDYYFFKLPIKYIGMAYTGKDLEKIARLEWNNYILDTDKIEEEILKKVGKLNKKQEKEEKLAKGDLDKEIIAINKFRKGVKKVFEELENKIFSKRT